MNARFRQFLLLGLIVVKATPAAARADQDVTIPRVVTCREGTERNVRWRVSLGSDAGPISASGNLIAVGTNTGGSAATQWPDEGGLMSCLRAEDGNLLWESFHRRLAERLNDIPEAPIRSRPWIDSNDIFFVSNRGELVCADAKGFRDRENDGPYFDEGWDGAEAVDVKWVLDMPGQLGVFKVDASDVGNPLSSPLVIGDRVFCVTGNGSSWSGAVRKPVHPDAPSFIAVDKRLGTVLWSSNAPGPRIQYGQWSSPASSTVGGRPAVLFPGGDARLYSFDAELGTSNWVADLRRDPLDGGAPDFFMAAPVVGNGLIYVSPSGDWESTDRQGRTVYAVAESDGRLVWEFKDKRFLGAFAAPVLTSDALYVLSASGWLFALDPDRGTLLWERELERDAGARASPIVHENHLYVPALGSVYVLSRSDRGKLLGSYEFGEMVRDTPAISGGNLYVAAGSSTVQLWAVATWDNID